MLPYRVGFWALLLLISLVWLAWRTPGTLRQNEEALILYKVLLQNESNLLSELDAPRQPCLERLSSPPFDLKTPLCLSAALYAGDTEVVARALDSEAFAALRPTYWHVIHRMGGQFGRQGDLVRAAQYFELGYQLQVNQISSLNELFSVLRQSGEFERAADLLLALEDSPTISPEQRQIWWAYHHIALEAWDEAESAFRALLSSNAYRFEALSGLAQVEWKQGHYEGSVQWYRQIIKEFPENNRAYGLIGALYLNYLGEPEAAIPYLREYVTRVQGQDQYQGYLWLGEAYARLNRSHDAVAAWQQAILLDQDRSEAICHLQALYQESPGLSQGTTDQATLAALEPLFELYAKACYNPESEKK